MTKIRISPSMLTALSKEDLCPASFYAIYIAKTIKSEPSLAMLKGSYFEGLCLGSSGKGEIISDLPRLKSGEKSVDQQRIEKQAEVFKQMCIDRPIVVMQKQLQLTVEYNKDYDLTGIIDFDGTIDGEETISMFDLKLTGSIYHEHREGQFGPWSWEFPYNMDFTQAFMYNYLYSEMHQVNAPFYYLVFDYKPESEYKIIRKKIEKMHILELMETIRKGIEKIEFHQASEWEYNPIYKNCIQCPLKNTCPVKNLQKPVSVI